MQLFLLPVTFSYCGRNHLLYFKSSLCIFIVLWTVLHKVILSFEHIPTYTPISLCSHRQLLFSFHITYANMVLYIYTQSHNHKLKKICNICFSETELISLIWLSPVVSTFLQM